jgi:glycine/D-amino acid oxidase-like deaminating enzyme
MTPPNGFAAELQPPRPDRWQCDVLVVGGGPAGASAAYWLASSGVDVLVVEKKHYPREKTCGDGLTPRSVHQLEQMGLADGLAPHHRYWGLRAHAYGRTIAMSWPDHPELGSYGYVITRADLDELVAARAEKAGAVLWQGVEAVAPLSAPGASATGAWRRDLAPGRRRHRERQGTRDGDRGPRPLRHRGRRIVVPVRSGTRDPA